jgi:uncharacterized protein
MTSITPQEMAVYQATARRRLATRRQSLRARRTRAWETARRAAALLKEQYGVRRVILFGSLSREEPFSQRSDVDLAVWGLEERAYYRAVSHLLDLDPSISVDLVRAEDMAAGLLAVIESEGISL